MKPPDSKWLVAPGPLRNTQVYMPVNAGWFVNGQAVTSPTALTGGLAGYLLTAGYDQATRFIESCEKELLTAGLDLP